MDVYIAGEIVRVFQEIARNDQILGIHFASKYDANAMDAVINDMVTLMYCSNDGNMYSISKVVESLKNQQVVANMTPEDIMRCDECMDMTLIRAHVRKSIRDLVHLSMTHTMEEWTKREPTSQS
jgi:hypothetical protein